MRILLTFRRTTLALIPQGKIIKIILAEPDAALREALRLNLLTTGGFDVDSFAHLPVSVDIGQHCLLLNKSLLANTDLPLPNCLLAYHFQPVSEICIQKCDRPFNYIDMRIPDNQMLGFSQFVHEALAKI